MPVSPNTAWPVAYETSIPGDTTLYYVRAILRDTASSTILQTLNLKNISSTPNRYVGQFSGVSDPSGMGRQVDVTISVYTDSGYTTLSPNYQIYQTAYTIIQPWIQNLGTGGGLNIDYDKLQKMFDGAKVTNAVIGNEKAPKVRFNYKRVEDAMSGSSEGIRAALSDELQGHVKNLSGALSAISKASQEAQGAHGARLEALELRIAGLESRIGDGQRMSSKERSQVKNELLSAVKEFRQESKKYNDESPKNSEKMLKKSFGEIQDYIESNLSEKEIKINYTPTTRKEKKEEEKPLFTAESVMSLLR